MKSDVGDDLHVGDPVEVFLCCSVLQPAVVVVPGDQDLMPLQRGKVFFRRALVPVEHISDDIDDVIRPDAAVPVVDQRLVHLFHRAERAVAMRKDIPVAEMGIGGMNKFHVEKNIYAEKIELALSSIELR